MFHRRPKACMEEDVLLHVLCDEGDFRYNTITETHRRI